MFLHPIAFHSSEYGILVSIITILSQVTLFTRTMVETEEDLDQLGEKALKETKEQRDMKQRLNEIELELNNLSTAVELEVWLHFILLGNLFC